MTFIATWCSDIHLICAALQLKYTKLCGCLVKRKSGNLCVNSVHKSFGWEKRKLFGVALDEKEVGQHQHQADIYTITYICVSTHNEETISWLLNLWILSKLQHTAALNLCGKKYNFSCIKNSHNWIAKFTKWIFH